MINKLTGFNVSDIKLKLKLKLCNTPIKKSNFLCNL